jgi:hypothetical protein
MSERRFFSSPRGTNSRKSVGCSHASDLMRIFFRALLAAWALKL